MKTNYDLYAFENELYSKGINYIGGTDEAGRGPLYGPVVAACCVLPKGFILEGLTDSKQLTEKKREKYIDYIKENSIAWAVGIVTPEEIDEINIYEASRKAMMMAIEKVKKQVSLEYILSDAMPLPNLDIPHKPIIKGDAKSITIAAASVIAKVTRDRMMYDIDKKYPEYGFGKHKGYPTKAHLEAINKYGLIDGYRKSYGPIAKFLKRGRRSMEKGKGFTLIELLAVILILGIISLISIPVVTNIIEEAHKESLKNTVKNISSATENKCAENIMTGNLLPSDDGNYSIQLGSIDVKSGKLDYSNIEYNSECNSDVKVAKGKYCAYKPFNSEKAVVGKVTDDGCVDNDNNNIYLYSNAEATDSSCFVFDSSTGTITGYDYNNCSKNVVIPVSINGRKVEKIDDYAFLKNYTLVYDYYELDARNPIHTNIESNIPNYIYRTSFPYTGDTKLTKTCAIFDSNGNYSEIVKDFDVNDYDITKCTRQTLTDANGKYISHYDQPKLSYLESVDFSKAIYLKDIGKYAFYNTGLKIVKFGNNKNITAMNDGVFGNNQITSIDIYNLPNLNSIGTSSFANNNIISFNLPNNIETIGYSAFFSNSFNDLNLSKLKNLKYINDSAFAYSTKSGDLNVTGLTNLEKINYYVFQKNEFENVYIKDNPKLKYIGKFSLAFNEKDMDNFIISNNQSLDKIDDYTAEGNYPIKYVEISNMDSLTLIPQGFMELTSIGNLQLKNLKNLKVISTEAFVGSNRVAGDGINRLNTFKELTLDLPELVSINKDAFSVYYASEDSKLEKLILNTPKLKEIQQWAFYNTHLTTLELPASLTTIGKEAFISKEKFTNVIIHGTANRFTANNYGWGIIPTYVD